LGTSPIFKTQLPQVEDTVSGRPLNRLLYPIFKAHEMWMAGKDVF